MTDKKDHSTNEIKGESSNRLVGDQSNQFVKPNFYGPVTFDQSTKSAQFPYPTKILFDDSYSPPTPPPLHELPEIASKPPGSYLPFIEDRNFTGRKGDLDFLAENYFNAQNPNPIVVIHGIGGLGKSHLAIRYSQLYGQFYQGVHWINAKEDFNLGVAICGEKMDIQPWPSETPDQVRLTKAVWAKSTPRLIILDDVIDGTHLQSLIRELPDAHILVTSRCENWSTGLPVADRDLDQMPPEEARSFLRRVSPRLTQTSDKDLDDLTTTLGGLPLALYLAGCYLNDRSNLPVAGYLQQISKAETLLKEREYKNWTDETFSDHSNSLLATFEVSWEMLEEKPDAETAKPLFQICGYCSPSVPIPHEFIESIKFDTDDKKQVILAIRLLKSVGLVESADQDILIHPLLAEFARLKDSELDGLEYASNSYGDYSYKILASGDPRVFTKHLQHIQQIAKYKEMSALNGASRLWSHLGLMNKDLANFDDSKANFERALHIDKQAYGKNHPSVATRLNNLGGVNKSLGNLLAAKSCLEQAVIIDTNFYGKSHPIVANDLNNLGNVLIAMDDLPAAKANLEKALTIDVQFYGEEHHTVANRLSNIGSVLQAMGDPLSAKINFEKALAIDIKWYGEEHTEIATDLNNLGSALRDLDDFITAKTNITQALILDIKFYGKSHPTVAIDLNNLGTVLQDLGNLPAAKANFEKALEILKTKLPPNHPTIHIVQNNLNLVNQQIQAQKELNE